MLAIDQLSKTYPNGKVALDGVTLKIDAGEIVAVIGGSGCGKSTLLRLLSGLDHATRGRVVVDGDTISAPHPSVGIVFQEPRLLPWLTVGENVGFGLADLPAAERRTRVLEALHKVGLEAYVSCWPRELSGGQGQRVALARALIVRPSVLLLDEPFSALDAFTRAELQDHLLELWADHRPTMVIVTHDIDEAVTLGTRVVVMRPAPGRIADVFTIDLPRPRNRLSDGFDLEKKKILRALNASLGLIGTGPVAA